MLDLHKRTPNEDKDETCTAACFDAAAMGVTLPTPKNITRNILTVMHWQKVALEDMDLCRNRSSQGWENVVHALENIDYSPYLKNLFRENEGQTATALSQHLLSLCEKKKDTPERIYSRMGEEGRMAWMALALRAFYDSLRGQVFGTHDIDLCPLKDPDIRITNPLITDNRESITYGRLLNGNTGPLYIKKEALEGTLSDALEHLLERAAFHSTRQLASLHYRGYLHPDIDRHTPDDVRNAYEAVERDFEIIRQKTNFDYSASPRLLEIYNRDADRLLTARHGMAIAEKTMLLVRGKSERSFGKIDRLVDRKIVHRSAATPSP